MGTTRNVTSRRNMISTTYQSRTRKDSLKHVIQVFPTAKRFLGKKSMQSINVKTNLLSHRFALKSRWIVWSSNWDLLVRYADIICPMLVVLSGNRHNSTECPRPSKYESSFPHCEVLPLRSNPSKTTSAPLDSLLAPIRLQLLPFSILIDLTERLHEIINPKFNDLLTAKTPKFLESN